MEGNNSKEVLYVLTDEKRKKRTRKCGYCIYWRMEARRKRKRGYRTYW